MYQKGKHRKENIMARNNIHKATNPVIHKWDGMTDQEWAELRYTARKHLDQRKKAKRQ